MSNKKNKKALLPKRRFPEFKGGWSQEYGDELFKQISNKQHDSTLPILAITQEHGAIPRHMIDYHVSVTEKSVESYKVVEKEDFIISLRSFQGGIEYSSYTGICSPAYVILRKKGDLSNLYFKHFFKTERFIKDLTKNLEGLRDGKMISYAQFSELSLPVPPTVEEQQKIADCLSSLDEVVAFQGKKVEALKDYKKGLMQRLFPREGQSTPELRFSGFKEKWSEKKIATALTPLVREVIKPSESYMGLGVRSHGKGVFLKPNQDPRKNAMDHLYIVHKNDLIVSITFAWEGAIAIADNDAHGGYVSHRFPTYVFNETETMPEFFRYIITEKMFVYKLGLISPGGAGRNKVLNKTDFLNISVLLPSLPEQQKIAYCLSSLDELILEQSRKLDTLKEHKKALMQQIFPSMDEGEA